MTQSSPDRTHRTDSEDTAFTAARPRLFAIAYRMLGSRADAEDVLQDAWMRWHQTKSQASDPGSPVWLMGSVLIRSRRGG